MAGHVAGVTETAGLRKVVPGNDLHEPGHTPGISRRSAAELVAWLQAAPAGVLVPVELVRPLLNGAPSPAPTGPATWRERLWTCPEETRLGVREVAEAMGRPASWVYRAVARERDPLPMRRLDGELVFAAGDVRAWRARRESCG
jgi:predicted DNA-binding transcriptional regulator AlpA